MNDGMLTLILMVAAWTFLLEAIRMIVTYIVKKKYVEVTAKVTRMDSYMSRSSKGRRTEMFNPELTYQWNGWNRTVRPKAYASYWNFKIGDETTIYVNPKDPNDFHLGRSGRKILKMIWVVGVLFIWAQFGK